jgi:transcriptional regulator with PAS, ATPase and Fis domain
VPFNVCALNESMFEDALFGHAKGAFTGAHAEHVGFLREANQGTVFLDEISGLALGLQAKLLRAAETGQFRPVGARRDESSDFRIVSASNEPVAQLVAAGRMRGDLAFRLSVAMLRLPPLRDRIDDVPMLANFFAARVGITSPLPDQVVETLKRHNWPGNVRELRNVVESCAAFGDVSVSGIRASLARTGAPDGAENANVSELRRALEHSEWRVDRVADEMDVHRSTIYRWIKQSGLSRRVT